MNAISLALLVAGLLVVIALMTYVSRRGNRLDKNYYKKRWSQIESTATNGDNGLRIAVIDGDKLVDHALRASRVRGSTMGERMKQVSYLKNIDALWTAHKLRNKLVHEPDVRLKRTTAMSALNTYKKSLKELGAL